MAESFLPELEFPPWFAWDDRSHLDGVDHPGVYLIALSERNLVGEAPKWESVSYIGMTNSLGGLRNRWRQFDRAVRGRRGHSGGNLIFARMGHRNSWHEDLFVTGQAIECDVKRGTPQDLRQMGIVAYLEYEAFARFAQEVGGKPRFNTQ
jgi:hypothetical protein